MRFSELNGRDRIEKSYLYLCYLMKNAGWICIPYLRRFLRFIALPYCYFGLVNWNECKATRFQVLLDLGYIFFILKYFPDNYSECRLWEIPRSQWSYYYGSTYDPYQRRALRRCVQEGKYEVIYEDKAVFQKTCKWADIPCPNELAVISPADDLGLICGRLMGLNKEGAKYILKPTFGKGGHGIMIVEGNSQHLSFRNASTGKRIQDPKIYERCVFQKYLDQVDELNKISPSVNTVRVVTIINRRDEVLIIGAYMRFGVGASAIDNYSKGGISVKINIESGELEGEGYDMNNRKYSTHPNSGIFFDGYKLPRWQEVLELASHVQREINFHRLLGMDIAICKNGPVIIEANSIYDNVGLEKITGPVLANTDILRAFNEYGLLVNNKQIALAKTLM